MLLIKLSQHCTHHKQHIELCCMQHVQYINTIIIIIIFALSVTHIAMIFCGGSVLFGEVHIYTPANILGTPLNKCSRVCLAIEGNFYYTSGKMKDGTPCPPTEDGYKDARCVEGNCVVSYSTSKEPYPAPLL